MPYLVTSISRKRVAVGVAFALLVVGLAGLGYYRPPPVVAAALVFAGLLDAVRGLQPFGETVAYYLLKSAAFAVWGLAIPFVEELSVVPLVLLTVGVGGLLYYGVQAIRHDLRTLVNERAWYHRF